MASFSLDDYKAAADKKYKGLEITGTEAGTITLRAIVRLSAAEREEVVNLQTRIEGLEESDPAGVEAEKLMKEMLVAVSDKPDALRTALGPLDLGVIQGIFSDYSSTTQDAEGKPSAAS